MRAARCALQCLCVPAERCSATGQYSAFRTPVTPILARKLGRVLWRFKRRKMDTGYDHALIRTVRGVGYQIGGNGADAQLDSTKREACHAAKNA
jgi:hypothetical protein